MSPKEKKEKKELVKLNLKITAPKGLVFEGVADFIVAPGREGVLGIGSGHTKTVALLKQGDIIVKNKNQSDQTFSLEEGLIQINRKSVEVLVTK